MSTHKFFGALLIAATTLAPTAAVAQTTSPPAAHQPAAECILRGHRVTSVTPYRQEEHMGKATFQRLRGANVYVQAEPGLTAEWLRLTLYRHITEMRSTSMRDCPFDVNDVTVAVDSSGAGFSVKIIARDDDHAEEVLRRAHLLFG